MAALEYQTTRHGHSLLATLNQTPQHFLAKKSWKRSTTQHDHEPTQEPQNSVHSFSCWGLLSLFFFYPHHSLFALRLVVRPSEATVEETADAEAEQRGQWDAGKSTRVWFVQPRSSVAIQPSFPQILGCRPSLPDIKLICSFF